MRSAAASVAALVVGAGILGVIAWKLPILELMEFFFVVVCIPLLFLVGIGLMGWGTYNAILELPQDFRNRVEAQITELRTSMLQGAQDAADEIEASG